MKLLKLYKSILYEAVHDQWLSTKVVDNLPRGNTWRNKEQLKVLTLNIQKRGFDEPLILGYFVDDNALRLMEGHHRLEVAKILKMKEVPIKILVYWNMDYRDSRNNDVKDQPIFHPPKPLDVDGYVKRNYFPTFIEKEEIGF